jgi:2,3-bisphosphoglycerate-dependent phosphoglycerate mutase
MPDFWFLRHGETFANRAGVRCGGDEDAALTAQGEQQAHEAAALLVGAGIGVILCAPLARTRRTAEIVSAGLPRRPRVLPVEALRERRLGPLNGVAIAASEHLLRAGPLPGGVEPEAAFEGRVRHGLGCIRSHLERRPLVVSSKGVARLLASLLLGRTDLELGNGCLICLPLELETLP